MKRIAVTGIGVICSLGRDQQEFWSHLTEGRCGLHDLDLFDTEGCLSRVGGQVPEGHLRDRSGGMERRASRTDRLCLLAAGEALAQAGLSPDDTASFGVSLGSSTAGMIEAEGYCRDGLRKGFEVVGPSATLRVPSSVPGDAVARMAGARGPRLSNMTACSSSAASIGFAADLIRHGDAPGMIAGGGDALCLMTYAGFNALRLLDPAPCRPFDASRQGLSLGEGAGILVLESWDHAEDRSASPLAEFLSYGASCDAHHMTAPHPEGRGAAAAMREALRRAGLGTGDIDHVNAHGTGTPLNDATEARALVEVLGPERAAKVPLTATKSRIGHLLGGAGGVEAVTAVLSLRHRMLPPTMGFGSADEGTALDIVADRPRPASIDIVMSNSFGFGGSNYALIFRRAA